MCFPVTAGTCLPTFVSCPAGIDAEHPAGWFSENVAAPNA